jgi:hypothetical protein
MRSALECDDWENSQTCSGTSSQNTVAGLPCSSSLFRLTTFDFHPLLYRAGHLEDARDTCHVHHPLFSSVIPRGSTSLVRLCPTVSHNMRCLRYSSRRHPLYSRKHDIVAQSYAYANARTHLSLSLDSAPTVCALPKTEAAHSGSCPVLSTFPSNTAVA